MRTVAVAIAIFILSIACQAATVANAPILFQGADHVHVESICSSELGLDIFSEYKRCKPRIEEYAGEKLIQQSESNPRDYSYVEYDPVTGNVTALCFYMKLYAYSRIKEVLEAKYGTSQTDRSSATEYWYGDVKGKAMIYLAKYKDNTRASDQKSSGYTYVTIITSAMRSAREAFEERQVRERMERKAKAIKGL
jgi:hypothetical protein